MARDLSVGVCEWERDTAIADACLRSDRPDQTESDYLETNNGELIAQKFYFHFFIVFNIYKSSKPFKGILLI